MLNANYSYNLFQLKNMNIKNTCHTFAFGIVIYAVWEALRVASQDIPTMTTFNGIELFAYFPKGLFYSVTIWKYALKWSTFLCKLKF